MSYRERQRLADIQAAIDAIRSHLQRGDLSDGLVFDAARIRLLEIGEAVQALPAELLDTQPGIPWRQIARMRDHLAHRYFDTAHAILQATVDDDLPKLERAVQALSEVLPDKDLPDEGPRDEDPSGEDPPANSPSPARRWRALFCRSASVVRIAPGLTAEPRPGVVQGCGRGRFSRPWRLARCGTAARVWLRGCFRRLPGLG